MESNAQIPIRVHTHNIRYATTNPFKGEKPWSERRQLLLNELLFNTLYNPESFICLQEVLHGQLQDIMEGLNQNSAKQWDFIGVGRDDGKEMGEYSPIIYRSGTWKLESWKTIWLSETPEKPSKGWDAASIRIVTVGSFIHRGSGKRVVGMCTHFDDQGQISRLESAKLVLKTVDEVTQEANSTSQLPVFLAGDLNSEPDQEAYRTLNAANSSLGDVEEFEGVRYGNTNTFTGFEEKSKSKIDFVFIGPKGRDDWEIRSYAVLNNKFEDGIYNSDHRAVVADLVLKR
ncbi:hypothetical protein CC78DRAFT_529900 [Lojkania enalia]|uniref:Endonuclease/exonuclease/phosphatase domain-containing protein n=1 Tax=Lojkania enalia TaxID=147567 RepID=A0A9P4N967_9PLEO|nr:hypothetical protein CC78DRAFT_529900 [Didymosphaeria enalia]